MWREQARLLLLIIKNGTAGQMRGIFFFATRSIKQADIHSPGLGWGGGDGGRGRGTVTRTSEVTQDT